jgi:hypothetical protein
MHRTDGANPGPGQSFVEGDPIAGTPATQITGDWLTAVQEEIAGVVEGSGLALDKPDNGQLLSAIDRLARLHELDRQLLVNGDFGIWQRQVLFNLTSGQNLYTADHWLCTPGTGGGAVTISLVTGTNSDAATIGSYNGLSWSQTAGGISPILEQRVEDSAHGAGQTVVFSCWAKLQAGAGLVNSISIATEIVQNRASAGNADVTTAGPSLAIDVVDGLVRLSGTFTLAADLGTSVSHLRRWNSIRLKFPTNTKFALLLYACQLELGSTPSPQVRRGEARELELCRRYYRSTYLVRNINWGTYPGEATFGTYGPVRSFCSGTEARSLDRGWDIPMWDQLPTIHWYSPVSGAIDTIYWEGADRAVTAQAAQSYRSPGYPTVGSSRAASVVEAHFTAESEIA